MKTIHLFLSYFFLIIFLFKQCYAKVKPTNNVALGWMDTNKTNTVIIE